MTAKIEKVDSQDGYNEGPGTRPMTGATRLQWLTS